MRRKWKGMNTPGRRRAGFCAACLLAAVPAAEMLPAASALTSYGAVFTYEEDYDWTSGLDEEDEDEYI